MSMSKNQRCWIISTFKTKIWVYAPVSLVCLLIIVVWSLLSLPIILYYYLPTSEISSNITVSIDPSDNKSTCSTPLQYDTTSGICLTEIANILMSSNCSPDPEGYLLVMRNEETTATQLINGLTSLGASDECLSKAIPFFCLHLFGLCGGPGVSIQPSTSQCKEVRDKTCQQQWTFIEGLNIDLPDCEIFPADPLFCPTSNGSYSTNGILTTDVLEKHSNNTTPEVLECTGDYYQENGSSFCTRSCYSWVRLGNGVWLIADMLAVVMMATSFLGAAAIIMISCLARKRMLIFPAVFIVYMTIDFMVLSLLTLIGFIDRIKFFCPSRSLVKSLNEVTPFCVLSGILAVYFGGQIIEWWVFHTATLFWRVAFPFHARTFESSGKNKYIYITFITVGILAPLVPIITIVADTSEKFKKQNENSNLSSFLSEGAGFGYTSFPPVICHATNSDAVFYSYYLFVDIILGCGCTMLIIIFWWVRKLYLKRKQVKKVVKSKINGKQGVQFVFGTAEKKLLILLSYNVIFSAVVLTQLVLESRMSEQTINDLQKFIFCELGSRTLSNPCIRKGGMAGNSIGFALFRILSFTVLTSFPLVNLLYVVNISELKKCCKKRP